MRKTSETQKRFIVNRIYNIPAAIYAYVIIHFIVFHRDNRLNPYLYYTVPTQLFSDEITLKRKCIHLTLRA